MNLLIRHLECTKKFLCLVHALWQNVIIRKEAPNNRQQAIQVYYLSYACQTKKHLKGWDVAYKVLLHGKLHVPNNEHYNLDPDTYGGEFFQEDGLEERFEIDLTEAIGMEVDIEVVVDEEDDEVQNENDLVILEGNDINDELAS